MNINCSKCSELLENQHAKQISRFCLFDMLEKFMCMSVSGSHTLRTRQAEHADSIHALRHRVAVQEGRSCPVPVQKGLPKPTWPQLIIMGRRCMDNHEPSLTCTHCRRQRDTANCSRRFSRERQHETLRLRRLFLPRCTWIVHHARQAPMGSGKYL